MNYSSNETVKRFGYTYKKQWLTFTDGRERDSHRLANGQQVPMNEKFKVGDALLEYPGDQSTTIGAEVINCRCQVVHIPVLLEY